eukprot:CAMPEP_0119539186 /NCGR_PEP_ID=MMETSP1344-20130328/51412_1 /TAXON_ID=236787 /ORGANISM="Florenciella parvula, Strain CCMP2471" /LENGTH=31 /DNA_ID= /DNA_START= /DNA_END= /DNA_ORIENTATION=
MVGVDKVGGMVMARIDGSGNIGSGGGGGGSG